METLYQKPPVVEALPGFEDLVNRLNDRPQVEHDQIKSHYDQDRRQGFGKIRQTTGRLALMCLAAAPFFGLAADTLTPTHTHLGSVNADVQLTLDPIQNIDLGFPGSFVKSGKVLGPFGAHVSIKEIGDSGPDTTKNDFSSEDLVTIAGFLSDAEKDQSTVTKDMAKHAVEWGVIPGDLLLIGLYFLLGSDRRRQLSDSLKNKIPRSQLGRVGLSAALIFSSIGATMGFSAIAEASHNYPAVNHVFDGTSLEGFAVKGKLLQVGVNKWGAEVFSYIKDQKRYWETGGKAFKKQFELTDHLKSDKTGPTVVLVSGLNCALFGEEGFLSDVIESYKPDAFIDLGDNVPGISEIDGTCISSESSAVHNLQKILVVGDHNLQSSVDFARKKDFTIANGQPIKIKGQRFTGGTSPRELSFGDDLTSGPHYRYGRRETERQMGHRIAVKSCDNASLVGENVVAGFNEPNAAVAAAKTGCFSVVFAGGYKQQQQIVGSTPVLTVGSASGEIPLSFNIAASHPEDNNFPGQFTIVKFANDGSVYYETILLGTNPRDIQIAPIQQLR